MHDTAPPRIPVPGEAPCADARRTMPTDDSTDALHAAEGRVPEGILNDTDTVSTTVVGGTDDTDGLSEGVTDEDALLDTVVLPDSVDDTVRDVDTDRLNVAVSDAEAVALLDTLRDSEREGDTDALALELGDALAEADALDDGELE